MKIAVSGGAGFIASHIVDAYIEAGHEVTLIDDFSSGFDRNINPKARVVRADIRDNLVHSLFESERFDVLNHHAAQIDLRFSVREPKIDAMTNVIGSLNLFEAALHTGVKKVIFASSAGTVYGHQTVASVDEEHRLAPVAPYGVAKLSVENYLYALQQSYALDYAVLRYSNVYGPRQNPHGEAGVIAIFLEKMLSGKLAVINGDGLQTRDYVFIDDVVRANVAALETSLPTLCVNISSGVESSVVDIVNELRRAAQVDFAVSHGPAASGEQRRGCYSPLLASKLLDWQPRVSLREGIAQTVAYETAIRKK